MEKILKLILKIVFFIILVLWGILNVLFTLKITKDTINFSNYLEVCIYIINILIYIYINHIYIKKVKRIVAIIYLIIISGIFSLFLLYLRLVIINGGMSNYDFISISSLVISLLYILIYCIYKITKKNS